MSFPHGVPVTVKPYTPGETDAHGNTVDAWGPEGEPYLCAIDSLSTEPVEPGRNAVVDTGKVYGPYGMTVAPQDKVVIRGVEWDVDGNVWQEQNPYTGWRPGCYFVIRKARG